MGTNNDDSGKTDKYEQAVVELLRRYGSCMEEFGRASTGSPVGMEATMRSAQEAAQEVLYAALGREPTLQELEQLPPLYEAPVSNVALSNLESGNDADDDEDPTH